MKNKYIIFAVITIFLAMSIFSIVFSYMVISHFKTFATYDLTLFKEDVELSIVIMVTTLIGHISLFYFLWKKRILHEMLNIRKKNNVA